MYICIYVVYVYAQVNGNKEMIKKKLFGGFEKRGQGKRRQHSFKVYINYFANIPPNGTILCL